MLKQLLLLFSVSLCLLGAGIVYEKMAPKPWPKDSLITYYNKSGYHKSLTKAIHQWEKTGIPVRFAETDNPDRADIIIYDNEKLLKDNCDNPDTCYGTVDWIGYKPDKTNKIFLKPAGSAEKREINPNFVQVIIHEIGHTLGLQHPKNSHDCTIMNSDPIDSCDDKNVVVNRNSENQLELIYPCGPWEDDVSQASHLYHQKLIVPPSCEQVVILDK